MDNKVKSGSLVEYSSDGRIAVVFPVSKNTCKIMQDTFKVSSPCALANYLILLDDYNGFCLYSTTFDHKKIM